MKQARAASNSISSGANANNQFALDLYSELKGEGGNLFFSPFSISAALTMTCEGARGQTAREMRSVFHFQEDISEHRHFFAALLNQLNKKSALHELHAASAIWIQKEYQILSEFLDLIQRYYAGKATNLDFSGATEAARKTINKWVEEKTGGKIKDLFPHGSLNSLTRLVLTNAIYFKGNWVRQFKAKNTRREAFRVSPDKAVEVYMMRRYDEEAEFNYAETEALQILEMSYAGEEISMLVLLPKNSDIKSLESTLTIGKLNEWKNNLRAQRVDVFIPKFTLNTRCVLNESLKKMGMPSAFTPHGADFSGIDGTRNLFIEAVIHQAFVDVNEEGTESAAVTGFGLVMASPEPVAIFRADHPFIFIIQERKTGNILFLGRLVDPS